MSQHQTRFKPPPAVRDLLTTDNGLAASILGCENVIDLESMYERVPFLSKRALDSSLLECVPYEEQALHIARDQALSLVALPDFALSDIANHHASGRWHVACRGYPVSWNEFEPASWILVGQTITSLMSFSSLMDLREGARMTGVEADLPTVREAILAIMSGAVDIKEMRDVAMSRVDPLTESDDATSRLFCVVSLADPTLCLLEITWGTRVKFQAFPLYAGTFIDSPAHFLRVPTDISTVDPVKATDFMYVMRPADFSMLIHGPLSF